MIEMNKIIPTTTGYGRANDIVIVDNSNIEKIYEMLHLEEVYHRNLFLDYNVNLKITPILYNKIVDTNVVNFTFLKLKPIKRITLYDICMNIKDDSFSGIDDEDLLFFYKVICIDNKNKLPRNLLITTPFVKKNDNTFGAAYELKNGEYVPLIFQPGNEIKDSHCINKKIGDTEIGKEFFKYVAIEEGKDGDILLSLCREFEGIENLEEYKLLMDKVLNIYVTFSSENRERVASKTYSFSKLAIFTTEDKEKDFCKPCECIYNKGPLNILFENEFIRILYSGIYDGDDRNKVLYEEFMRFSGVKTKLTYLRVAALSHLEKLLITRLNTLKKKHVEEENHDIEGLDSVLTNMTLEKSFALWNLLLYTPSEYYHGVLSWVIGRETFPSVFLKKLRNNSWIYLDGFLYSPLELFQEELPEEYTKAPDIMMQSLQFMNYNPNIKFTYQRFKSYIDKGYSRVASIDKLIKEQDEIEIDVDDVEAIIQEYNDTAITEDDNAEEMGSGRVIGGWGEKFVFKMLEKEFIDNGWNCDFRSDRVSKLIKASEEIIIKLMDEEHYTQEGYDILITLNGKPHQYVEVKSKKADDKNNFAISRSQWEMAYDFFDNGEGEKYCICFVNNAGSANVSLIRQVDPYRAWTEKKLGIKNIKLSIIS